MKNSIASLIVCAVAVFGMHSTVFAIGDDSECLETCGKITKLKKNADGMAISFVFDGREWDITNPNKEVTDDFEEYEEDCVEIVINDCPLPFHFGGDDTYWVKPTGGSDG